MQTWSRGALRVCKRLNFFHRPAVDFQGLQKMKTIVKSFCARLRSGTCGIRVTVDGHRITETNQPFNQS
jgi:hypothetical protein